MNERECELLLLPQDQRLNYYRNHIKDLENVSFVFFDCLKSNANLFSLEKQYNNIEIVPMADYEHMFLLDKKTYNKAVSHIRTNIEVHFDSNIFGKLKDDDAWCGDILKLKEDLNNQKIATNIMPFTIERSLNEYDINEDIQYKLYDDIKAYFKIFSDYRDDANLAIMTDRAYDKLIKARNDRETRLVGDSQHFASYAYLLKTFLLYNKYSSVKERICRFVDFINTEIYVYLELPTNLCIDFLTNRLNSTYQKFFKHFNPHHSNYGKLLRNIKGMAWDLTLIYNSIRAFAVNYKDYNSLKLIYFATADRELARIIKTNQVKSLSIVNGEVSLMHFDKGLKDLKIDEASKSSIAKCSDTRKYNYERMDKKSLKEKLENEVALQCLRK